VHNYCPGYLKNYNFFRETNMWEQIIELDCPPGDPRPGGLIEDAIKGAGLELRQDVSRFFGSWIWDYSDIPAERWERVRPILKRDITRLYRRKLIRYGSW
jgi:hypothetical protein